MTSFFTGSMQSGPGAFLVEASSDAVIGLGMDGMVTSVNPAALRLFGYRADELVGAPLSRLLPTSQDAARIMDGVRDGLSLPPFETRCQSRDDGEIGVGVTASPVRDAQGAITGGVIMLRDAGQHGLLETAERYRQLTDLTREAWWEEDLRTGEMTSSRRFCQMLGLDETMLSYPLSAYLERIHPDDLSRVVDSYDRSIQEGTDFMSAYRMRHAEGHYIWVENRSRIVARDDEGKPARALGAITDITARMQAETALRESEKRYRMVAEITQEAWWEEDIQAAVLTNSPRFCDITGRGEEILVCTVAAFREWIHPDDVPRTHASHDKAVLEGAEYRETYRFRHADGHYIWVEDWARVVARDEKGRATRMLGSLIDVTARRQAEIALLESEENFRRLFDDAPDAYLIVDSADGRILVCNHAAARMLRGKREQIVGMQPGELSPPFQPDGTRSADATLAKLGEMLEKGHLRFEWMHRRFDGTDFWAEVVTTVGTFRQRPAIYTSWREIGEIIAAKQAAEAASIAKSQFLSVMSHELRTPLSTIMGMFQLIEHTGGGDKVREYAGRGLKSSEHLLKLVEDILDFSSIEAGRLAIVAKPFQLGALLDEVGQLAASMRKAGVNLDITLEDALRPIELLGDPLRLKQVLINLLGNALKFTDRGRVALSVSRAGGTPERPLLEFAVADTGIGLTPDQQTRLFQPFTQLDMSNVRRFGGTGLGLVISQRLVGLLGGEPITVESNASEGSRFAFRLALPATAGTVAPQAVSSDGSRPSASSRLSGARVLLVEDNRTVRLMLRLLLEAEGASVEEAGDGAEGMRAALSTAKPFDLVLMDMQMPVMDGLEATRQLRARGYSRPIVALTANAYVRDREACLAAGMDDYMAKPVKIADLAGILQRNRVS